MYNHIEKRVMVLERSITDEEKYFQKGDIISVTLARSFQVLWFFDFNSLCYEAQGLVLGEVSKAQNLREHQESQHSSK